MSETTERAFEGWQTEGLCGESHDHFMESDIWDWYGIAREGRRLFYKMRTGGSIDATLSDEIISGVAAQAAHGAYASVAAMMGLDTKTLQLMASEWYENKDDLPPSLGRHAAIKIYKETVEWQKELERKHARKSIG